MKIKATDIILVGVVAVGAILLKDKIASFFTTGAAATAPLPAFVPDTSGASRGSYGGVVLPWGAPQWGKDLVVVQPQQPAPQPQVLPQNGLIGLGGQQPNVMTQLAAGVISPMGARTYTSQAAAALTAVNYPGAAQAAAIASTVPQPFKAGQVVGNITTGGVSYKVVATGNGRESVRVRA